MLVYFSISVDVFFSLILHIAMLSYFSLCNMIANLDLLTFFVSHNQICYYSGRDTANELCIGGGCRGCVDVGCEGDAADY